MTKSKKNIDNNDELGYSNDEEIVLENETEDDSVKRLREKLNKCVAEKQEYLDGWQRTQADFVNFKKGEEERKSEIIKFAKEDFIENLLPVLDSFNMATENGGDSGLTQIKSQFLGILKREGVEEINPEGESFDPNKHEAVEMVEGSEGEVIEVLQKGYSLHNKIIRPARVKVGK